MNCDLHAPAVVMRCGVGTLRWAVTDPSDVGPWLRASCCGILTFVALCSAVSAATAALDREAALRYVLSWRTAEGGYCFYRKPKWGVEEPNAPDTLAAAGCDDGRDECVVPGAAIRRRHRRSQPSPPEPERTERFLCSLQDEDGDYPTLTSDRRRSSVSTRSVPSPVNPPLRGSGVGWACCYGWGLGGNDTGRSRPCTTCGSGSTLPDCLMRNGRTDHEYVQVRPLF